ncbi:hypothetical protein HDU81_011390 [Chytriomyces hyalinus]|nr:hypothetical protein HDU81_011390 [Chytriomyces hyalinus]
MTQTISIQDFESRVSSLPLVGSLSPTMYAPTQDSNHVLDIISGNLDITPGSLDMILDSLDIISSSLDLFLGSLEFISSPPSALELISSPTSTIEVISSPTSVLEVISSPTSTIEVISSPTANALLSPQTPTSPEHISLKKPPSLRAFKFNGKPKKVKCELCGKTFTRQYGWKSIQMIENLDVRIAVVVFNVNTIYGDIVVPYTSVIKKYGQVQMKQNEMK